MTDKRWTVVDEEEKEIGEEIQRHRTAENDITLTDKNDQFSAKKGVKEQMTACKDNMKERKIDEQRQRKRKIVKGGQRHKMTDKIWADNS